MGARAGPPLLAFLLQRLVLCAVALASGLNPFASPAWVRWDSGHYLTIAASGYSRLYPCPPESGYPAEALCGNAGWFPGYPLLIRMLGGSPGAGALLSALFQLLCLMVIWRLLDARGPRWPALLLAAFFPGNVYMAAVFPVSLVSLAVLACLGLCLAGRFGAAAVAAAVAAAAYPTGVLLAPVVAVWALLHRRHRALLVPLGALAGYAAVLALLQKEAGRWDAYYLLQRKYGYRIGLPFDALFARLKPLVNRRYRTGLAAATAAQALFSTLLMLGVAVAAARNPRAERTTLPLLCAGAFWLAPLMLGGNLSLYRAEALLLPAVLLVPALPRAAQLLLAAAAAAISVPMAAQFFSGALV